VKVRAVNDAQGRGGGVLLLLVELHAPSSWSSGPRELGGSFAGTNTIQSSRSAHQRRAASCSCRSSRD
jgi:hypothetical protein